MPSVRSLALPGLLFVLALAGLTGKSVAAVPLAPGGSVTLPGELSSLGSLTLIDSRSEPISVTTPGNVLIFTGLLDQQVYQEAGGTLDFYFQIQNVGLTAEAVSLTDADDYVGFSTAVDYLSDSTGTVTPASAVRTGDGSTVAFDFAGAAIPSNGQTKTFFIQTNATAYDSNGTALVQSPRVGTRQGGSDQVTVFEPAVPEPATSGLLAAAGGAALLRRRVR